MRGGSLQPNAVLRRSKSDSGDSMHRWYLPGRLIALRLILCAAMSNLAVGPSLAQTYKTLYEFTGGADGAGPGGLTLGPDGAIYGVTNTGGHPGCYAGCGTIFVLSRTGDERRLTIFTLSGAPPMVAPQMHQ
jgi:hypothetical protein